MLTYPRETVLGNLFALLQSVTFSVPVCGKSTFSIVSRKLVHWSTVSRADRPALFMTTHSETPVYRKENLPAYLQIKLRLFVYTDGQGSTGVPDSDQSVVLDAIDSALSAPGSGVQTLGSTVSHCRIDGEVVRDPGDLDGDGVIIIPVTIALT